VKRREFIALVGGAAVSWPLAARAQQAGKLPTIGFLGADASAFIPWTPAFVQRPGELGWIDGRTVAIEYRWSEGRPERAAEIAAEFVRLKVDVIVTYGTAVPIVKQATTVIPIVFTIANDPVGGGLVASLARPGGNITGLSMQSTDLAGKRFALLREVVPGLRRLAIMVHVGSPQAVLEMSEGPCSVATPKSSTRFCAGRSPPIFRSSNQSNSISSSISRPPRCSDSPCRKRCSPPPTR